MTETLIYALLPEKIRQLGYEKYHTVYRDITLKGNCTLSITAYNDLYFIVDSPQGIIIESDYGIYDSTGNYISEHAHIHRGELLLTNPSASNKRLQFIQVVIIF
jgi:hypothetical protein